MSTALLYAPVPDTELLQQVGFYRQDIDALEGLGFSVRTTNSLRSVLTAKEDLVYIWWWTHALAAVLRSRAGGPPVLITGVFNYEGVPGQRYRSRPLWQRSLIRTAASLAEANVFVSNYERDVVTKALGIPIDKSFSVPLEIPADAAAHVREASERDDFFLQIAWSGRGNLTRKCVYETISACEEYAETQGGARLLVAGNVGDGAEELQRRCDSTSKALKAEYLGRVSEQTKWELLSTCRAYVSPSQFEGFGLAIAEAMATGAPTITSPVGAVPEVCGDAVEFCNGTRPSSILDALVALDDDARRSELSLAGRRRIAEHNRPGTRRNGLAPIVAALAAS